MADFRLNPFFKRQFAKTAVYQAFMLRQAMQVREEAKRIARAEAYRTGAYHESIKAKVDIQRDDVVAYTYSDDYKARWIELGTATGFVAKAPLRRALESQNLRRKI